MRRLKVAIVIMMVCIVMNVCFCVTKASAAKCKDVTMDINPSLYGACNGTGANGAMWISSSNNASDIESIVDYNGTDDVINVYMHGVVIDNDGDEYDRQPATCIKMFTTGPGHPKLSTDAPFSKGGTLTCSNASIYDGANYKFTPLNIDGLLSNSYGRYLNRSLARRGTRVNGNLTYNDADEIMSTSARITLKVSDAIKGKTCTKRADKSACDYDISVNFFRCFYEMEDSPGFCYSDASSIRLSIKVPGFFVGTSAALTQKDTDLDDCRRGVNGCRMVDYDASHRWKPESGSNVREYTVGDTLILPDCDPGSGCKVTFRHYLKRTDGVGEAKYVIYREGSSNSNTGVLTASGLVIDRESKIRKDEWDTITIYPGQKVCERLEFRADGKSPVDYPNGKTTSRVCAVAVGGTESSIGVKVRNTASGSPYGDWNDGSYGLMYAKPRDELSIWATFTPRVQAWYWRTIYGINGTIGEYFNRNNDLGWQNVYSIKMSYGSMDFASCVVSQVLNRESSSTGTTGFGSARLINMGDVGKSVFIQAATNCTETGRNTPKRVNVAYNDRGGGEGEFSSEVNIDPLESNIVEIMVPYNFNNSISMDQIPILYAGEEQTLSLNPVVTVGNRYNKNVNLSDDYATKVDDPKVRVCIYEEGNEVSNCDEKYLKDTSWNVGRNTLNLDSEGGGITKKVPDVPAGTTMCVQVGIYPATVAGDAVMTTEWNEEEKKGSYSWTFAERCGPVVKKPSFQVWGGDVFVENGVNVPLANKTVLDGYSLGSVDFPRKFGSWGELSVETGSGGVDNLFSGAALGFAGNNGGVLSPYYSFSRDGKTADYEGVGNKRMSTDPGGSNSTEGGLSYSGGSMIDIEDFANKIGEKIDDGNKHSVADNYEIGSSEVGPGTKQMYVSAGGAGDIIVNGDIRYSDSGGYETLESIPKVIIYANNIKIDCSVERIDAILIAKGNIETCPFVNDEGLTDEEAKERFLKNGVRSVQLRINGAVIAGGTVSFNRSYGAGTGANSMIPAEIINMDPSWYLWMGEVMETSGADEVNGDSGLIMPTYVNELPPRY